MATRGVIYIVVCTLAVLCVIYMLVLAGLLISGVQVDDKIMKPFEYAGVYALGAFTGMLVNTHSQPAAQTGTSVTSTTSVTETSKPVEPPAPVA